MNKAGIYIHIPFCKSKCPYCDFYSMRLTDSAAEDYTASVIGRIAEFKEKYPLSADTLYLGGGTPSLIGAENIAKIVEAAKAFGNFSEITVECNPSCVEDGFFEKVFAAGVNRISLGLQSASDSERRSLGRLAGVKEAENCIRSAQNAGIENISLDVMIGIPNQTMESLDETLTFCVNSGAVHISAYMLKLEEGTFFHKNQSRLNLPDDDFTADAYLRMVSFLESKGFPQYEISNFSQKGFESRHNMKYWLGAEYLGIGPAAHSFVGGNRFYFPRDIEYFMNGGEPVPDGTGGDIKEYIMLRLRLKEGVKYDEIRKYGCGNKIGTLKKKSEFLARHDLARINDGGFSLTPDGFLISNTIIENITSIF